MKRYISLILVAVVLICCLAVPSYAAESNWIDVLSYGIRNNNGSNAISVGSGQLITFDFPKGQLGYVDFVVQFNVLGDINAFLMRGTNPWQLQRVKISDYVYRFYGQIDFPFTDGFSIYFENLVASQVEFLSFKASSSIYLVQDTSVIGLASYANGEESAFYYNGPDDRSSAYLPGNTDFNYDDYIVSLTIDDWRKYDYIDLQLYVSFLTVSSINVSVDGVIVPVESNIFSTNQFDSSYISLQLDLTNINRSSSDELYLILNGSVPTIASSVGSFSIMHANGLITANSLDQSLVFFTRIKSFFTDAFGGLANSIQLQLDRVGSWFENYFSYLNTWLTNQTSAIGNVVDYWFGMLEQWISSVGTKIETWGQNIFNVLVPNSDASDEVIDSANQQAQQVQQNNDALQQMPKPDLSGAGDISGITNPTNTVKYTLFLNHVMTAPIISEVITLSLIFSLAAYVLFGKRG